MFRLGPVRVRLDKRATRALRLPGMGKAVEALAEDISSEARALANSEARDKGNYANGFKVITDKDGDRAVAAVYNDDEQALRIEFGTRTRDGKAILRRAGERVADAKRPLHKGGSL